MKNPNDMPTLAERLRNAGGSAANNFALFSLFLADYIQGLGELTGCTDYFASVYKTHFTRYDPDAIMLLAEMTDKAANFIPEARDELLYLLLVQPFYYIDHVERSQR